MTPAKSADKNSPRLIHMPDSLWERVRAAAVAEDRTMSSWVRRAIEAALMSRKT